MVTFLQIQFDDDFEAKQYLRNNRSSGQKSLRCFPRCCDRGHQAQGFCGTPIYAVATLQKTSVPIERVMMVAEIRPELEPGLTAFVGQQLPKQEILECIRSDINKKDPDAKTRFALLPGEFRLLSETAETYSVGIMLNDPLHSYDYSWKSNRWASGTTTHVVDVIALSDDSLGKTGPGPHTITVLTTASSPSFVVASTKKAKVPTTTTDDEQPAKAEKKRKQAPASLKAGPAPSRKKLMDKLVPARELPMAGSGKGSCMIDCLIVFLSVVVIVNCLLLCMIRCQYLITTLTDLVFYFLGFVLFY